MVSQKIPSLKFEVDDREMLQNEYSLLKLKITNIGEIEAKDVNIRLYSEIDEKLSKEAKPSDYSQLKEIKPYESKEIIFGFYPTIAGKVSLTIISSCKSVHGINFPEKKNEFFIRIKDGVFRNQNVQSANLGAYRQQAISVFSKGKITQDERALLDVLRIKFDMTRQQQKQIEDEILRNYSDNKAVTKLEKQKEEKPYPLQIEIVDESCFVRITDAKVRAIDKRGMPYPASVGSDGTYLLELPKGTCKIEVDGGGNYESTSREVKIPHKEERIKISLIKRQPIQIEIVDEAGNPVSGINVSVKETTSQVDANGSPGVTDNLGIAKFTISKNKQYDVSVRSPTREFIDQINIPLSSSETTKRIQLSKKAGTLEISVSEQATGKLLAGILVSLMKKGASQAIDFATDNNGRINQKLSIGDYIVRLKMINPPLYDPIEKQVTIIENRTSSVALDFRFSYQPKPEFLNSFSKINEKLNTGFKEVSTYDTCIPLLFKKVGEKPTQLVDKIIKRPGEFMGVKTSPDEIIKYTLSTTEVLADEISRIMREKSNVDFYFSIRNLATVDDLTISDYSQEKFNELVHDTANYHKNHFREVGNKLNEIDNELTQLSGTLTMHPVADLWRVAQKLLENSMNEADPKKRGVMLFINDKLLDHVREMYTKEEVKARLKFSSPNEASLIIVRAKKLLEEAKNLGLHIPEDQLEDAELHLSKSYADAFIKARNFEKEVENAIEELRQKAGASINNLELGLEKLKKLSLSYPGINEVKEAYKARDYNKATEAAGALIQKIESLINNSRPSLVPQLKIVNFKLGAGRKTQIIIHNEGATPATNVSSELSGDITIRVLSKLELLNPGESRPIEVWIKPTVEGDLPLDVLLKYSDGLNRNYEDKRELWIGVGETATQLNAEASDKIEIKRGFGLLPNNDIRFGIRIKNGTGYAIMDVEILLDFNSILFSLRSERFINLGNLHPGGERTGKYILKPLGCIHNEQINALITYKDHTGKKQTLHMRPKEVHCVCPFLKETPMSEGEYSRFAAGSEYVQEGISFKGVSVEDLAKFMGETCRHMLYKVKEYDIEGKKVIYLSGESLGEKAYYLLTVVIQEYKGLTQVVLRAHSDKKYGLNGFMNEMADSLRHLVGSVQNAKEIGIIENTQVINIIDSVVQRTNFEMGRGKGTVNISDSVVQRSNFGESEDENKE